MTLNSAKKDRKYNKKEKRSIVNEKSFDDMPDSIYWKSHNNAGLFSQFLQLKIMHKKISELGKKLIIIPVKSRHFGMQKMHLCNLFELPSNISCVDHNPDYVKCTDDWDNIVKRKSHVCYGGKISFTADSSHNRRYILEAVNYELPLKFDTKYNQTISNFVSKLSPYRISNYTVVHWRRGDQLTSRCKQSIDTSVNCLTADDLLIKIREYSNNSNIFIATNEKKSSVESNKLMKTPGVKLFHSVDDTNQLNVFEILVIEVYLMIHAEKFLGWGVSEINDVVVYFILPINCFYCRSKEYERMKSNKSFCEAQEEPNNSKQETWCSRYTLVCS